MKRLILALIILLAPVMALLPTSDETASALSGYVWRKSFLINGSNDGVQTNYQLKLTVNNSSGVSTGSTVYLNGSSLSWPNDFRFTNASDGNLDFWIESNTSTEAIVWVEFDSIVNGSTNQSSFYMYYGKAGASAVSDITTAFIFGDDFNRSDSGTIGGGWTEADGAVSSCSISSNTLLLPHAAGDADYYPQVSRTITTRTSNFAIVMKAKANQGSKSVFILTSSGLGGNGIFTGYRDNNYISSLVAGPAWNNQVAYSSGVYQVWEAIQLVSASQWHMNVDGTRYDSNMACMSNISAGIVTIALNTWSHAGSSNIDYIFIRNWTANEPTFGAWGTAEAGCLVYLTTSSGSGGNVSSPTEGTSSQSCNASVNIVATADTCYHFVNWTGNTTDIANTNAASTTIAMGTTNKTATANFAINTSTITYTAGTGGTINGTSPQTGNCGSNTTSVTAVANACYYFVNWSGGSTSATRNDTWTSTNQTFTANFDAVPYGSPTSLSSYADANSVNIAWAKGTNTSETYIRWKVGSYSVSITDGNIIANQSGYSYTHTGLLSGTSYYYTLWGKNGSCLSTGYSQILCTTTAGYTGATPNPLPQTDTSGWFGDTNASALVNNPLYPAINQMADGIGMPYKTWWILLTIGFMVMVGIWVFVKTDNLLLAIAISVAIGVIAAVKIFLIPVWIAIVMVIIAAGFGWKELR